jgi:hypothetical protein
MEDADGQVWMMDINVRVAQQALVTEVSQDYLWLDTECFCCSAQFKQAAWVVLNCALLKANAVPSSPDQRALATVKAYLGQELEWDATP